METRLTHGQGCQEQCEWEFERLYRPDKIYGFTVQFYLVAIYPPGAERMCSMFADAEGTINNSPDQRHLIIKTKIVYLSFFWGGVYRKG